MRGNIKTDGSVGATEAIRAAAVPFTFDFARVKSYDGETSTGYLQEIMLDLESLAGRDVLLVEDVVDTGTTMAMLLPKIQKVAASVKVVSLLEKRTAKSNGLRAHYVGFSIPDHFVVGYNLDFDGAFRELDHVCIINRAGVAKFRGYLSSLSTKLEPAGTAAEEAESKTGEAKGAATGGGGTEL